MGKPPLCRILVSGLDGNGQRQPGLTTTSQWKAERFKMMPPFDVVVQDLRQRKKIRKMDDLPFQLAPYWSEFGKPTDIAMAVDDWQEVRFVCKPGSKVQVLVDGRTVGALNTESLSAVEIRGETYSGTWIDDVELLYSGDAETLKNEHVKAVKADLARRQTAWKQQAEE